LDILTPSILRALACTPAARLTPIASRMTTKAKNKASAKISEETPSEKPIAVAMAMARALWLDGMPPVFQNNVDMICLKPALRLVNRAIRAFANWATKRLIAAEKNTSFLSKAVKASALWCSIARISVIMTNLVKPYSRKPVPVFVDRDSGRHTMPYTTQRFIIGPDDADRRLDRIIRALYADKPLSFVYRLFRDGSVRLAGKRAVGSTRTAAGDVVEVRLDAATSAPRTRSSPDRANPDASRRFRNMIVIETPDLVVINKPAGILTHGPDGIDTLVRAYFAEKMAESLVFVPAPLHRLDRNTSGALAVSASLNGATAFSQALRNGLIHKTYLALLGGDLDRADEWQDSVSRDTDTKTSSTGIDGKHAVARAEPLVRANGCTLAMIHLETGRTHQIRAQAASRGLALPGDTKYGGRPLQGGYMLHCLRLVTPPGVGSAEGLDITAPLGGEAIGRLRTILGKFLVSDLPAGIFQIDGASS